MKTLHLILILVSSSFLVQGQEAAIEEAERLINEGHFAKAATLLEPLTPSDHTANLLLGRCYVGQKKYQKAIDQLKLSKRVLKEEGDYQFWLGQAYLGKLNNTQNFMEKGIIASRVREAFEKAVSLDPENLNARNSLAKYYLNAPAIAGGSTVKALEHIDYIKSRNAKMGYNALAGYYYQQKEYSRAIGQYQAYLPHAREDSAAVLYQIGFIHQIQKNYPEAFTYFHQTIQADPTHLQAYYQYARTAVFSGNQIAEGIRHIQYYIEQGGTPNGPDPASAYWRMGMLYEAANQPEKAKAAYDEVLRLNPDHEEAKKARGRL